MRFWNYYHKRYRDTQCEKDWQIYRELRNVVKNEPKGVKERSFRESSERHVKATQKILELTKQGSGTQSQEKSP